MRIRAHSPCLIVLAIECAFISYLIVTHRGVIGHDAFQYFGLQYYFLSNAATSGEIAQWMPLMTHGTVSNWWFGVQAGTVQTAMLALGSFNRALLGWNFLPLYYLGILFDITVLLLGVTLLGRRYYKSNLTILFVAVTVLGSAIWFTQVWYNLHLFVALPLIFHWIHSLFETGKWRYFLFAGNLFLVASNGIPPYCLPLSALVVCLYAGFYVLFFWKTARTQLGTLFSNWKNAIAPVFVVAVTLYCVNGMLVHGTEEIANYNVGRTLDGRSVSLDVFLKYGTNSNLRWSEALTRISPALDYSIYVGYLALAFAGLAFVTKRNRMLLVVTCTAFAVFLIANATPVASFFYYTWPKMQFFRHLGLASPIVRTLLCFVAGFGFERLFIDSDGGKGGLRAAAAILAELAVLLTVFSRSPGFSQNWVRIAVSGMLRMDDQSLSEASIHAGFVEAALWCFGAAVFLGILRWSRIPLKWLASAAIVYQALDIYSFQLELARIRTVELTSEQYDINRIQQMPYSTRRLAIDYKSHPRGKNVPQNNYVTGAVYWSADSYMFTDPPANIGRTDHWLWALDDFLRTYTGGQLRDGANKPSAFQIYGPLKFPYEEPAAEKLAGITEDKIQFFSRAHPVDSDLKISEALSSKDFRGDILFVSGASEEAEVQLDGNERLHLPYDVEAFDANNIKIRVQNAPAGAWLYYADCWHPFWHVMVNGNDRLDYKASLAYKAVPLDPGANLVQFKFHSSELSVYLQILSWNALLWVIAVLYMSWKTCRDETGMFN